MKKHLAIVLALLAVAASAPAQITTDKGARSDQIQIKMHRLELLARIMPLALTKDQLNQLYPLIEKVRSEQKRILSAEDDALLKLEPEIDEALKKGLEGGSYPSREALGAMYKTLNALTVHRQLVMGTLADEFYQKVKTVFNQGQMTIMAKAVREEAPEPAKEAPKETPKDPKAPDPADEARTKTFIKAIFLDPLSYDILLKLGK